MNRIIIGSGNNEIGSLQDNKITIDITSNTNILIKDSKINTYVFNVFNSNVNILNIKETNDDVSYEINVFKGKVSFNNVDIESKNTKINVNLNKEDSSVLMCNSVISRHGMTYEIKVKHNCKNTYSSVNNNGITKGDGSIFFDVVSILPKNSKHCRINQDSKIISLNDKNDNKINPVLLIDEYEAQARHAAFIGDFNNQEIFYMMTRGLNELDAKNLLISGMLIGSLDVCFEEKEKLRKKFNEEWR